MNEELLQREILRLLTNAATSQQPASEVTTTQNLTTARQLPAQQPPRGVPQHFSELFPGRNRQRLLAPTMVPQNTFSNFPSPVLPQISQTDFENPWQPKKARKRKVAKPAGQALNKQRESRCYFKDVILLPSPTNNDAPDSAGKVVLHTAGFMVSGFSLDLADSEEILRSKLESEFHHVFEKDTDNENINKFEFVRVINKKVVNFNANEYQAKLIHFISGRDKPIYIRCTSDVRKQFNLLCSDSDNSTSSDTSSEKDSSDFENDLPPALFVSNVPGRSMSPTAEVPRCSMPPTPGVLGRSMSPTAQVPGHLMPSTAQVPGRSMSPTAQVPGCSMSPTAQVPGRSMSPISETPRCSMPPTPEVPGPSMLSTAQVPGRSMPSTAQFPGHLMPPTVEDPGRSMSPTPEVPGNSMSDLNSLNLSFEEALKILQNDFSTLEKKVFDIRHTRIYEDALKKMQIFFPNSTGLTPIFVNFIGEVAIDEGGPSRELFSTTFSEAKKHILKGTFQNRTLLHDLHQVEKSSFLSFGKITALALLQCGLSPNLFSEAVSQYILGLEPDVSIDQVPDCDVQMHLMEVKNSQNQLDLDEILKKNECRFEAGYNTYTVKFKEKYDYIKKIAKYFIITLQLEEIQQFCLGLANAGVLDLLKKYPEEGIKMLKHDSSILKAQDIKEIFTISYSSDEEDKKQQMDIIFNWKNFLDEVEQGLVKGVQGNLENEDKNNMTLTLNDVIKFLTGSENLPFGGITGKISFENTTFKKKRLTASTCFFTILFPINERYLDERNFTQNLFDDIIESPGFGKA